MLHRGAPLSYFTIWDNSLWLGDPSTGKKAHANQSGFEPNQTVEACARSTVEYGISACAWAELSSARLGWVRLTWTALTCWIASLRMCIGKQAYWLYALPTRLTPHRIQERPFDLVLAPVAIAENTNKRHFVLWTNELVTVSQVTHSVYREVQQFFSFSTSHVRCRNSQYFKQHKVKFLRFVNR